jgi:putative aminopeptidase
MRTCFTIAGLLAGCLLMGCGARGASVATPPSPQQDSIQAIKRVERELGFTESANFEHRSGHEDAYYRCYYTGKLNLPDSYEGLRIKDGDENGCELDEEKHDVFFYKIEAVAGIGTPITEALEESSIERLAVVVSHEDFHEDPQVQKLPTRIGEAATTLVGFLVAARFARDEYGADSETYRNLEQEAGLYRRKSEIVNQFHAQIADLFDDARRKRISRTEAESRKEDLYAQMQTRCEAIQPEPTSFNKCLAANNNAGLAFDMTYTRFYPLLDELHRALESDIKRTISALREAGDLGTSSERRTEEHLRSLLRGER